MEIRNLRYFLAVAREENMTRAAELLHVTQPTLSKALRSLEDELGCKLFERHSFSISLTDEGILLRERAGDLLDMADKIEREFLMLDDITGGDLYLGLGESYQIRYLARAIRALKDLYPKLRYHITSGDTEQVTEKLDKGLLDFAVLCDTPDPKKYDSIEFPEADVWGVVMPRDCPLAKKKTVRADDLIGLPLITSEQSWKNDIPKWCSGRMDGLNLDGSFRLAYNASIFVMEGLGYQLTFDKLEINLDSYELLVDGKKVDTPPKELELLYHLAATPNRVYTRNQLLDEVWGFDYFGDSRTVDVHIKRLREKVENVSDQWALKTVWGVGYKFEVRQ